MTSGESGSAPVGGGFGVVVAIVAMLVVPATLTLWTVAEPGRLVIDSPNPTPYGYTWSLSLFLIPLAGLGWWLLREPNLGFQRKAFRLTIGVLAPLGFVLDILLLLCYKRNIL